MADFNKAFDVVLRHEGTYANNSRDTGGETYCGISRKHFPKWKGWATVDFWRKSREFPAILDKDQKLQQYVRDFYKANFWDACLLDQVDNQAIATELFDTGVNMGIETAGKFLQRALNVANNEGRTYPDIAVDGVVGPKTVQILNGHKYPNDILKAVNCLQGAKYIAICEANPSQEIFWRSWISRVSLN